jgi:DNA-binding beta-propeller fold protein YncE
MHRKEAGAVRHRPAAGVRLQKGRSRGKRVGWTVVPPILVILIALWQRGVLLGGLQPDVRLGAAGQPMVERGGSVPFRLSVSNWGFEEATALAVTHTLPGGFTYEAGTTEIRLAGEVISHDDPYQEGQNLTWSSFTVPEAVGVFDNHYGIHTFVQDLCLESYVDFQLDQALSLVGVGGHVTQLLYPVTNSISGPSACWVHFVEAAYDRTLAPIVRLQGEWGGDFWLKPEPDSPGHYDTIAEAYKRVVEGLPRRDGHTLYVQIWNEPDVPLEWSGEPNAWEYGHFFTDVAAAIHSIGDPRIRVLNGAMTPGNTAFTRQLIAVPGFTQSFDLWASHCYPFNHPPSYNIHQGTARYPQYAIDCYLLELSALAAYGGRSSVDVMLTETGYRLYDQTFRFEGYAAITEGNRAEYMKQAFRDFWSAWPEVIGATPFELVDPYGTWSDWDWLHPGTDVPHEQYTVVKAIPKPKPVAVQSAELAITFRARASDVPGTYLSDVMATADNSEVSPLLGVAPVMVVDELHRAYLPWGANEGQGTGAGMESQLGGEPSPALESLLGPLEPSLLEPQLPEAAQVRCLSGPVSSAQALEVLDRVQVGPDPQGLALDPSRERAYVTLDEGLMVAVDTSAGRVSCTARVGERPLGVAVNPANGRVYVANSGGGSVSEVEGTRCEVERTFSGLIRPSGVVADGARNRVYVADTEAGQVVVLDGESDQVVGRVLVGSFPEALSMDQASGLVYVANAGDGTLSVIEGHSQRVVSTFRVAAAPLVGLSFDESRGRAYVVHVGSPPGREITAVDGVNGELSVTLTGDWERPLIDVQAVAVDATRDRLYVGGGGELLLVDTEDWTLVGVTPVGGVTSSFGLAADPASGRVYLLDSVHGELVILGARGE